MNRILCTGTDHSGEQLDVTGQKVHHTLGEDRVGPV